MTKSLHILAALLLPTWLIWSNTGEYSLNNLLFSLIITLTLAFMGLLWAWGAKQWRRHALPSADGEIPAKTGLVIILGIILSAGITVWLLNGIFTLAGGLLEK